MDSLLEFKTQKPVRYTLLLDKSFPELTNFTIVFWIRVSQPEHKGTIFSYQQGERKNVLRMFSGPTLQLEVWGDRNDTRIKLQPNKWHHIGITWTSEGKKQTLQNLYYPYLHFSMSLCTVIKTNLAQGDILFLQKHFS